MQLSRQREEWFPINDQLRHTAAFFEVWIAGSRLRQRGGKKRRAEGDQNRENRFPKDRHASKIVRHCFLRCQVRFRSLLPDNHVRRIVVGHQPYARCFAAHNHLVGFRKALDAFLLKELL